MNNLISLKINFLLLMFTFFGLNLIADLGVSGKVIWQANKYMQYTGEFKRNVPIMIIPSCTRLADKQGDNYYELTVVIRLDKADSLYKQGESFVIGHSNLNDIGKVAYGDSVEFASPDYAILDDDNPQTIFTFRIKKAHKSKFYTIGFGGGRLNTNSPYYPLGKYGSASFQTDHSITALVEYTFSKLVLDKKKKNHRKS